MISKYMRNYSNTDRIVGNNPTYCNIALFAKNKQKLLIKN